jgi:glycerol uptake facilitator-like aquaporin
MEIEKAAKNKTIVFVYEFIGTAMLLYAINLQYTFTFGVFGIGFVIFPLILIAAPITGSHFNPAITIGVYLSNRFWQRDWSMFLVMILA